MIIKSGDIVYYATLDSKTNKPVAYVGIVESIGGADDTWAFVSLWYPSLHSFLSSVPYRLEQLEYVGSLSEIEAVNDTEVV